MDSPDQANSTKKAAAVAAPVKAAIKKADPSETKKLERKVSEPQKFTIESSTLQPLPEQKPATPQIAQKAAEPKKNATQAAELKKPAPKKDQSDFEIKHSSLSLDPEENKKVEEKMAKSIAGTDTEVKKPVELEKKKKLSSPKVDQTEKNQYSIEVSKLAEPDIEPTPKPVVLEKKPEPVKQEKPKQMAKKDEKKAEPKEYTIETTKLAEPEPEKKKVEVPKNSTKAAVKEEPANATKAAVKADPAPANTTKAAVKADPAPANATKSAVKAEPAANATKKAISKVEVKTHLTKE